MACSIEFYKFLKPSELFCLKQYFEKIAKYIMHFRDAQA